MRHTTGCRVAGRRNTGRMLGLTPDPLGAGVGMHVAVAGPYTATNGSPRGRTVQTRNGRIPPGGPFRLAAHARRTAPSPACRKRPVTIHADRRRPRLNSGWLPVAGPAARRAAGRGRPRRPLRGSTVACACSGLATCSSSGNSTGRGAPRWPRVGGGRCCSQSRRCSDARPRRCGSGCGKRSVMLGTRVLSCMVSLHLHESEQFTRHLCPSGFCTGSGACDAYAAGRGGLGACLLPASRCLTGQRLPRRDWARPRRSANSRP